MPMDMLERTGWISKIKGVASVPNEPTCTVASTTKATTIDYFIVSNRVKDHTSEVTTVQEEPFRPHKPVVLHCTEGVNAGNETAVVKIKAFPAGEP